MSDVLLIVYKTFREHKHITFVKNFGDMTLLWIRSDKSNPQCTFDNCQNFDSTRMGVWSIDSPRRKVNTNKRNAECVESRNPTLIVVTFEPTLLDDVSPGIFNPLVKKSF
ncbi:hypothetical protein POM88_031782 [Heracleum sosnowskyi]|uniref:Uncharacterized protein n=1 Tax=Heracleum sosnowskyi TaxID=360622 RepID=A0AAD8MK55_9APIA|nr:hypothetical protein POM88_031782 [Heracleum sosnowskyi]